MQSILSKPSCLVLADVLGGHPVFKLVYLKVLLESACPVSSDFNVVVLEPLLEDGLVDVRELPLDFVEVDLRVFRETTSFRVLLLLFQVSDDVGRALALDEVLVVPRLGVEDLFFGFNLANSIHKI